MRRHIMDGMIIAAALAGGATVYAQGAAARKVIHPNPAGSVTGSAAHEGQGSNGGVAVGGRRLATDGQGNAADSTKTGKAPSGATGVRAGGWTGAVDGGTRRHSGAAVSGARGMLSTSSPMTRRADESASGARITTAAVGSGAVYQGQTTYEGGSGLAHTRPCTNAAGGVVACTR